MFSSKSSQGRGGPGTSNRSILGRLRPKKEKSSDSLRTPPTDGGTANGFPTVPEKEVLQVEAGNVAPFTLPQELLSFEPSDAEVALKFKNGDSERKLHCNIPLLAAEEENLRSLRKYAMNQGSAFLPSISAAASRYLSHAKGNYAAAHQMMLATQNWRLEYFDKPIRDADVIDDMKHGIVYWIGRDRSFRPTLVFRASRIPQAWQKAKDYEKLMRMVIFCVEYFVRYMVVPGRVESFNIIVDLKDVSVSQVPVSALREMHGKFGSHYCGRGSRTYICNMSWMFQPLVKVLKSVLSERQSQKMAFVKNFGDFAKDYALHQLEEDLGGTTPVARQFFPFPLQAGPFEAGYKGGPGADRVPRVHEALTREGARGRLWDSGLSLEENKQLEYTEAAAGIFKACGLPLPSNCPRQAGEDAVSGKVPEAANGCGVVVQSSSANTVCSLDDGSPGGSQSIPPERSQASGIRVPRQRTIVSL